MIRTPLFLALAAMALPAADAATGPDLTLYSGDYESLAQYGGGQQGYALVRQTHRFDLQSGANRVSLSGPQNILLPSPSEGYEAQLNAIKNLVADDPGRVAQVVKEWINADE